MTTEKCQDCGAAHQSLHLRTSDDEYLREFVTVERASETVETFITLLRQVSNRLDEMFEQLPVGTKYNSSEDILADIQKRYDGLISSKDMPFRELENWTISRTKKFQAKVILASKQGWVCNRCDSICKLDDLEIDHVIPDRSRGQLTNLQLLCRSCHKSKQDGSPTEKDISPFRYRGKSCHHRLTCVDWANISEAENS